MTHALGVYFAPEHSRQSDRDYIAALQPPVIRILDPDVQQIADAHALAPNAIIAPRMWSIDDNNGQAVRDLMADPTGTGRRHADEFSGLLGQWREQARQRGLTLPPDNRILFSSANEPNQGGTPDKIAAYCIAFFDRCTELGLRACGPCLGVGWPDNSGPDTPVNWTPYAGLERAIQRNGGMLSVHEYFYKTGPQDGWRWLAGRHLQCPLDMPILLGEIGIDNYVDKARWDREGGNRGWQGNVEPDVYAEMIERHLRGCDRRVVAGLIFITDYRSNAWESFDTSRAHQALLARKDRMVPQASPPNAETPATPPTTVRLPQIEQPQPASAKVPALAHPIQDPAKRTISQRFGENPADYARFGMAGHNGIDFACPVGTVVCAVDGGVVQEAGELTDYGTYIKLRHTWGESLYAHLSKMRVEQGMAVGKGEPIALSGNSGNSTGPHLHLGIRIYPYKRGHPYDGYSDPQPYLGDVSAPPPPTVDVPAAIKAAASEFGVQWQLLASQAWAESSFNPKAQSSAGAKGLMQIMDVTWAEWSPRIGAGSDPFDALQSARVGAAYLLWLIKQTDGFEFDALVAYGWGIGNWLNDPNGAPEVWLNYASKIIHGRDLLKALEVSR